MLSLGLRLHMLSTALLCLYFTLLGRSPARSRIKAGQCGFCPQVIHKRNCADADERTFSPQFTHTACGQLSRRSASRRIIRRPRKCEEGARIMDMSTPERARDSFADDMGDAPLPPEPDQWDSEAFASAQPSGQGGSGGGEATSDGTAAPVPVAHSPSPGRCRRTPRRRWACSVA